MRSRKETSHKLLLGGKLAARVMFSEMMVSPVSLWGLIGAVVVLQSLSVPTNYKGGKLAGSFPLPPHS